MRTIISILLFLFAFKSEGQIINASQPYRPQVASCSYLLDQYSGAAAAYSLRKLDCDYTGSAIRVRRSSDNTESDIGFTANGDLDTATLKTFVGANNGYVVTWYSQIGSKNVTQATLSSQPSIILGGTVNRQGTRPALKYDGTDYLGTTDTGLPTGEATIITVSKYPFESVSGYKTVINYGKASIGSALFSIYTNDGGFNGIGVSQYGDIFGNSFTFNLYNIQFIIKPSTTGTWYQYVNNSISSSKSMTTNTDLSGVTNSFTIGSFNAAAGIGFFMDGFIQECVIWATNKGSDRTAIESNINTYYSIY